MYMNKFLMTWACNTLKRNRIFQTKLLPAIWLDKFLMSLLILDRSSPRDLSMASLVFFNVFWFWRRDSTSFVKSSIFMSCFRNSLKRISIPVVDIFSAFFKGFVRMPWNMEKCKTAANRHQQGIMVKLLLNFVIVKRKDSKVFPLLQL